MPRRGANFVRNGTPIADDARQFEAGVTEQENRPLRIAMLFGAIALLLLWTLFQTARTIKRYRTELGLEVSSLA